MKHLHKNNKLLIIQNFIKQKAQNSNQGIENKFLIIKNLEEK